MYSACKSLLNHTSRYRNLTTKDRQQHPRNPCEYHYVLLGGYGVHTMDGKCLLEDENVTMDENTQTSLIAQ